MRFMKRGLASLGMLALFSALLPAPFAVPRADAAVCFWSGPPSYAYVDTVNGYDDLGTKNWGKDVKDAFATLDGAITSRIDWVDKCGGSKNITLYFEDGGTATTQNFSNGRADFNFTIQDSSSATPNIGSSFVFSGDNITIQNLIFDGGRLENSGLMTNVLIKNNTFNAGSTESIDFSGSGTHSVVITYNTFNQSELLFDQMGGNIQIIGANTFDGAHLLVDSTTGAVSLDSNSFINATDPLQPYVELIDTLGPVTFTNNGVNDAMALYDTNAQNLWIEGTTHYGGPSTGPIVLEGMVLDGSNVSAFRNNRFSNMVVGTLLTGNAVILDVSNNQYNQGVTSLSTGIFLDAGSSILGMNSNRFERLHKGIGLDSSSSIGAIQSSDFVSLDYGVDIQGGHVQKIEDNTFSGMDEVGVRLDAGGSIDRIVQNDFSLNDTAIWVMDQSQLAEIANNTFDESANENFTRGIVLEAGEGSFEEEGIPYALFPVHTMIEGNFFRSVDLAMGFESVQLKMIQGNVVESAERAIEAYGARLDGVQWNDFEGDDVGLYLDSTELLTFEGNWIQSFSTGLFLDGGAQLSGGVQNSIFSDHLSGSGSMMAIHVRDADGFDLINNTFYGVLEGIKVDSLTPSTSMLLVNNLFAGGLDYAVHMDESYVGHLDYNFYDRSFSAPFYGASSAYTLADLQVSGWELNGYEGVNPLLDPALGDFSIDLAAADADKVLLRADSSLLPALDFSASSRPACGFGDLGALEYAFASTDADADGFCDGYESNILGTDPSLADTDGDGLSDFDEVTGNNAYGYTSDPTTRHSDGDGIEDGDEVNGNNDRSYVSDPMSDDSDGDGYDDDQEVNLYNTNPLDSSEVPNDMDGDFMTDDWEDRFTCVDASVADASLDGDGDGLLNSEEFAADTDPCDTDSDDDGLSDYDEVVTEGTDPNVVDGDGDGLSDGEEVNTYSTDPLTDGNSDSDSLTDAEEILGTYGYVTDHTVSDTDGDGLDDYEEQVTYAAVSTWAYAYLLDPTNSDSDGDGLGDGDEVYGLNAYSYTSDPTTRHSDGDSLNDGREINYIGTDPETDDTDGDGLDDGEEVNGNYGYTSDPTVTDTDSDTLSDYDEVTGNNSAGYISDPNDTDTDGDQLNDDDEINATYGYLTDPSDTDTDGDGLTDYDEVTGNNAYSYVSDPTTAHSDSDSFDDYEEVVTYGTDPMDGGDYPATDTDGDGLTDEEELSGTYGAVTDPNDTDSDDDGLTDYEELVTYASYSLDPNSADTDGDGFVDGYELDEATDPADSSDTPSLEVSVVGYNNINSTGSVSTWASDYHSFSSIVSFFLDTVSNDEVFAEMTVNTTGAFGVDYDDTLFIGDVTVEYCGWSNGSFTPSSSTSCASIMDYSSSTNVSVDTTHVDGDHYTQLGSGVAGDLASYYTLSDWEWYRPKTPDTYIQHLFKITLTP